MKHNSIFFLFPRESEKLNIFLHYYSSFNPPLPAAVFCQSGCSARQLCAPAALGLKVSAAAPCIYLIFSLTQCLPPVLPAEFLRHMAPSSAGQHMAAEDPALVWIEEGKPRVDEGPIHPTDTPPPSTPPPPRLRAPPPFSLSALLHHPSADSRGGCERANIRRRGWGGRMTSN